MKLLREDDFVLTLSDDDALPSEGEEEVDGEFQTTQKTSLKQNFKRKRVPVDSSREKSTNTNRRKKQKKSEEDTELTDDVDSKPRAGSNVGDKDGAMDSDFEFQVGDVDSGITDDFDGWGLDERPLQSRNALNKKGVDIDELVARRRDRISSPHGGTENGVVDGVGHGSDDGNVGIDDEADLGDREGEEEEDLPPDNGNGLGLEGDGADEQDHSEDDELLAPDGFGMGATGEDESDAGGSTRSQEDESNLEASANESAASPLPHPDDRESNATDEDKDKDEDVEDKARREAFFAPEAATDAKAPKKASALGSFQTMSLSRPILRGLASVGFSKPTPIQTKTIPVALLGKDVVGGAVTGSGKTAAFVIPILERLLYRPKKVPTSRVAILMPTRELAVQCFNVARKLASFTDISFCQLVGGFSLREQETVLRSRPDVIIATPGRFIDHMRNSASFTVDTLEILVLDEADRMLEDGFADELNEILTTIPKSRQTMLFSATMTDSVDKLIRVGLNRPVRLFVDPKRQTVGTLTQEFVRLRPGREDKRLAYLLYFCSKVYSQRCIIFFRQKKEAHRVRIVFALVGFKAAELHGSMSQEQRITSVESFRAGTVTHLLATDVASRGLDIKNVDTVLNYEAPSTHETYLHRVGRTARAGRVGRSCTLAAEPDRRVVKAAVRSGRALGARIVSRTVDAAAVEEWADKLKGLESEVEEVLREEKEERLVAQAEMQVRKGENLMAHESEILARPQRTWFESEREKREAKKRRGNGEGVEGARRGAKKTKLSGKDKKRLDDTRERKDGKVWKKGKEERGKSGGKGNGVRSRGGKGKGIPGGKGASSGKAKRAKR